MTKVKKERLRSLGDRISKKDKKIIELLGERMKLAREIGVLKNDNGCPIVRKKVERQRMAQAKRLAREAGLNTNFAIAFFHLVILESCHVQENAISDGKKSGK